MPLILACNRAVRVAAVLRAALALLGTLLAPAALAGAAPVFWVGPAGPCNFNSIQTAINAVPDGAVIRIASNQAYVDINVAIVNKSLTLEGGWTDCTGATATDAVLLNGDPDVLLPVIRIHANAPGHQVVLRRLHVRGGTRSGVEATGPVTVDIRKSLIDGNQAQIGGGVRFLGSGTALSSLILFETLVGNTPATPQTGNQAINGGGVGCTDASVHFAGAQIRNNQATDLGGGLYLDACNVSTGQFGYTTPGYAFFHARIDNNRSLGFGGGVYARAGSRISYGPGGAVLAIVGNRATRGGGVYLSGDQTRMLGVGLVLDDNIADDSGGGGYLDQGARLIMQRQPTGGDANPDGGGVIPIGGLCGTPVACSLVRGNRAAAVNGNAFFLNSGQLELRHTELSGNGAGGRSLILASNVSEVLLESSLLTGNDSGGSDLIRLVSGNAFVLRASTITGNISGPILRSFTTSGDNYIDLVASIVWQPGSRVYWPDVADILVSQCLNAHEATDLPATTHDPGFVDAAAGDVRLRGDSANLDACANPFAAPAFDLFGNDRPYQLDHLAGAGPADRGALELGDGLFEHDFEPPNPLEAAPAALAGP